MKIILAATHREAMEFCIEHKLEPEDVAIVKGVRSLEGLRFRYENVIRVPGWSYRNDIEEIEDWILRTHVSMGPRFTANNEVELEELVFRLVDEGKIDGICTYGTSTH